MNRTCRARKKIVRGVYDFERKTFEAVTLKGLFYTNSPGRFE
jgi:hypothetical protein